MSTNGSHNQICLHADQFTVILQLTSKLPCVHFKADVAALVPSLCHQDLTSVFMLAVGLCSGTIQCCCGGGRRGGGSSGSLFFPLCSMEGGGVVQ